MGSAIAFVLWMFCIRYCTYQVAKRVIGPYNGFVLGALFNIWGIWMVRSSRLLLDGKEVVAIEGACCITIALINMRHSV